MPNFLQRLAAGMEIPGSTNLFVQPEDDDSEDWGQLDSDDDEDLLLDDNNDDIDDLLDDENEDLEDDDEF